MKPRLKAGSDPFEAFRSCHISSAATLLTKEESEAALSPERWATGTLGGVEGRFLELGSRSRPAKPAQVTTLPRGGII